jgi:hypothetical protein
LFWYFFNTFLLFRLRLNICFLYLQSQRWYNFLNLFDTSFCDFFRRYLIVIFENIFVSLIIKCIYLLLILNQIIEYIIRNFVFIILNVFIRPLSFCLLSLTVILNFYFFSQNILLLLIFQVQFICILYILIIDLQIFFWIHILFLPQFINFVINIFMVLITLLLDFNLICLWFTLLLMTLLLHTSSIF